ncbi:hypothetical protein BCR39DRAFT_532388 [Naematelia encephala]|uniref:DUF1772-domain-containing protein n=1 Tax=Naematelia encephala TaxID=71784 RepID=A0A1Y2B3C5_9TREE|nr:hypothetical protein BCR39DRAFT_532388 [Naematelia encephala]
MSFPSLPLAVYPLGITLLTTSSMVYGNVGLSLVGPVPIITETLGQSTLSPKQKVRVWSLFFKAAAVPIVRGTLLNTVLFSLTAYLTPSSLVRRITIASAVSAFSILPWTVVMIQPTNKALLAMDSKEEITPAEEADVDSLIQQWNFLHKWRYVGYGGAWLGALAGFYMELQRAGVGLAY